jgi:hypothetical protein
MAPWENQYRPAYFWDEVGPARLVVLVHVVAFPRPSLLRHLMDQRCRCGNSPEFLVLRYSPLCEIKTVIQCVGGTLQVAEHGGEEVDRVLSG